jgi:hypothetical protein
MEEVDLLVVAELGVKMCPVGEAIVVEESLFEGLKSTSHPAWNVKGQHQ